MAKVANEKPDLKVVPSEKLIGIPKWISMSRTAPKEKKRLTDLICNTLFDNFDIEFKERVTQEEIQEESRVSSQVITLLSQRNGLATKGLFEGLFQPEKPDSWSSDIKSPPPPELLRKPENVKYWGLSAKQYKKLLEKEARLAGKVTQKASEEEEEDEVIETEVAQKELPLKAVKLSELSSMFSEEPKEKTFDDKLLAIKEDIIKLLKTKGVGLQAIYIFDSRGKKYSLKV